MLQVRKSFSCGISAISFQCCFMSETQVLMSFQFFGLFSRNHFLEGGFIFQWGASFLGGGRGHPLGASVLMWRGRGSRNHRMGKSVPHYRKPCILIELFFYLLLVPCFPLLICSDVFIDIVC